MEIILFWSHFGDSLTVIFSITIPQYLGVEIISSTLIFIFFVLLSIEKLLTDGVLSSKLFPSWISFALRSLATPKWLIASALFGVRPISKIQSVSTLKISDRGEPASYLSSRIIIPSSYSPRLSSSWPQIIPLLISPRILLFFILSFSLLGKSVVPTVATATVWFLSTLGAPQTIWRSSSPPTSTVVMLSLSAFGCFFIDLVFPTTTPFSPPGIDSNLVIPSTSRPREVNLSPIDSWFSLNSKYSLSQL